MIALMSAEALKLRTTRTFPALILGAVALAAVIGTIAALTASTENGDPGRIAFAAPGVVQAFALLLGALAVTSDVRHGTLTPALLVTPDRRRLLAAKLLVAMATGLLLAALAYGLAAAIIPPALETRDVPTALDGGDIAAIVTGGALGGTLFAALGVGLGALVRNQVGAIVAALGWLYVVEQTLGLVPGLGDLVRQIGLAGLSSGLSATEGPDPDVQLLGQIPAGLLLTAYAATLVAAGATVLRRRDVTA